MRWEKMGLRAAGEKGKYVTMLCNKSSFLVSLSVNMFNISLAIDADILFFF